MNYSDYFSNLSSYEEYVLKCTLLGKEPNDPDILNSDVFHHVDDNFWFVVDGYIAFIDPNTGLMKDTLKIINVDFDCSHTNITSLEGAPREVGRYFNCSYTNITSLEGTPQEVGGYLYYSYTNITSLEGTPQEVGGYLYYSNTKVPKEEIKAYEEFLRHPTLEHIDETGHYKP